MYLSCIYSTDRIQNFLELGLTAILTIATVLLTYYTCRLVSEARKSRKIANEPYISIFLNHAETDITLLFINIENIGGGPAYNLKFEILKDLDELKGISKISERGFFKNGMSFYPPKLKKRFFLLEATQDYSEKMNQFIKIKATYDSMFKERKEEVFEIRLNETEKSSSIDPPDTYIGRIYKELKGIKDFITKDKQSSL